jgi:phenylacetate-CoA ligase
LQTYVALACAGLVLVGALALTRRAQSGRATRLDRALALGLGIAVAFGVAVCAWQLWAATTHINEDHFLVEIVDPETNRAVPAGERGNVYITCLFKYAAPVIRFNVNDVSAISLGECRCGGTHRRLAKIFGRADNMVKLRGVNLFPEAVGALIAGNPRSTGEYVCVVEHVGEAGRDEMTVMVEMTDASVDAAMLQRDLEQRFREALSVKLIVQPVERGMLDSYTGLSQTSKIKRLIDKRKH